MSVPAAYLGVVLVWATTPLAIQWSADSIHFSSALLLRMMLGAATGWLLCRLLKVPLPWDKPAWRVYLAISLAIAGGMVLVYAAAKHVPSGLISVVYGASPVITGVLAMSVFGMERFQPKRLILLLIALAGLALAFVEQLQLDSHAWPSLIALLCSTLCWSFSGLLVKQQNTQIAPLAQTVGGLIVSLPALALCWWLLAGSDNLLKPVPTGGPWLEQFSGKTLLGIGYLGVVGSVLGFMLYYYVLTHMAASKVATITLITPLLALWLGYKMEGEALSMLQLVGAGITLLATAIELGVLQRLTRSCDGVRE